jgi:hypothetical protein
MLPSGGEGYFGYCNEIGARFSRVLHLSIRGGLFQTCVLGHLASILEQRKSLLDRLQIRRHQTGVAPDHLQRCVTENFLQMKQTAAAPQVLRGECVRGSVNGAP